MSDHFYTSRNCFSPSPELSPLIGQAVLWVSPSGRLSDYFEQAKLETKRRPFGNLLLIPLAMQGEGALFKAGKELDLKSFLEDDLEGPLNEFLKKEVREKFFGLVSGMFSQQLSRPSGMDALRAFVLRSLSWDCNFAIPMFEKGILGLMFLVAVC